MDHRLFFPATQRNKEPIKKVLSKLLPQKGTVLEIASGSGEHGVTFQEAFPAINWQTSDPNPRNRDSIQSWIEIKGLERKMASPLNIDVLKRPWPISPELKSSINCVICINMLHITNWICSKALIEESSLLLQASNSLIIYGPFKNRNGHFSKTNEIFDHNLKSENPLWGIRDLEVVNKTAMNNNYKTASIIRMPSNNHLVVFNKK